MAVFRAWVVLLLAALAASAQPLQPDPRLVVGRLDNGLRYVVLRHTHPPGAIAMALHVHAGSLNETDRQRGAAHFIEHMAFNGSAHFPPGAAAEYFQRLGLEFGRDQNVSAGFDHTTYRIELPEAAQDGFEQGLLFFSDLARGPTAESAQIEAERDVLLQERRARLGPRQRVRDAVLARLAPGSLLGDRLTIGTEESIRTLSRDDLLDYSRSWYVPSNMTLVVVADADPAAVVERIGGVLSAGPTRAVPDPIDTGVRGSPDPRAIVVTDEELSTASVAILRIDPPNDPVLTRQAFADRLVDRLAVGVLDRRLDAATASGEASFQRAMAFSDSLFGALYVAEVWARGRPDDWRSMIVGLAHQLQRARVLGVDEREVADAGREILARARRDAEREPTLPAGTVLRRLIDGLTRGDTLISPSRRLDLTRRTLPNVTPTQVSEKIESLFKMPGVIFLVEMPAGSTVPSEREVLAAGLGALTQAPEANAEARPDRPDSLLRERPTPGRIVEISQHPESGVWSGWLSNGVRVHVKPMHAQENVVSVAVTLAGGEILETADDRGVTAAALRAWRRPATRRLDSTQIKGFLTGTTADLSAESDRDAMTIRLTSTPDDLETGFQVIHLMLTDPYLEPPNFKQWRQEQIQRIAARRHDPDAAFSQVLADTIYPPGEVRTRPLGLEQIQRLSRDQAQAWLDRMIAEAPIEATVVGDLSLGTALDLLRTYLGSVPPRARISASLYTDLRDIARPAGPLSVVRTLETRTDKAIVLVGFFGPDAARAQETRLLSVAARAIRSRLEQDAHQAGQPASTPYVKVYPGRAYPGYGMLVAFARTDPAGAEQLADRIEQALDRFASTGPTQDELDVAVRQSLRDLDQRMGEPDSWTGWTQTLTYRGLSLDDVSEAAKRYGAITVEQVLDAFNRYAGPESRFRIIVRPEQGPDPG